MIKLGWYKLHKCALALRDGNSWFYRFKDDCSSAQSKTKKKKKVKTPRLLPADTQLVYSFIKTSVRSTLLRKRVRATWREKKNHWDGNFEFNVSWKKDEIKKTKFHEQSLNFVFRWDKWQNFRVPWNFSSCKFVLQGFRHTKWHTIVEGWRRLVEVWFFFFLYV